MIGRFFASKEVESVEKPAGFDAYELRLGDVMRGERATLGKSLLDVQRELKIKATYVAAIENSDPSAFESPSFIAGYVRSYARYLGLDPEWAYEQFCSEGDYATAHGMSAQASNSAALKAERKAKQKNENLDPLSDPNAAFVPQRESIMAHIEPSAIGSVLVLLTLIGGIGYGGWAVLQEVQRVQFAPVEQAPGVTASIDPLATSAPVNPGTPGLEASRAEALDRLYRPQVLDVPVMVARDGPISALNPDNFGTLAPENNTDLSGPDLRLVMAGLDAPDLSPPDTDLIKVVEDAVPEVAIFAVRPAWVRIKSADGTVIFEKIMNAGERFILPNTEEPPLLRTGYAGTVYFAVNGQAYGPAGEGASVVSEIALGQEEITASYELADLSSNKELASVVAALSQDPVTDTDE